MHSPAEENDPKRAENPGAPEGRPAGWLRWISGWHVLGWQSAIRNESRPRRRALFPVAALNRRLNSSVVSPESMILPSGSLVCRFILVGRKVRSSLSARQFGTWLEKVTGVPVVFYDERFSPEKPRRLWHRPVCGQASDGGNAIPLQPKEFSPLILKVIGPPKDKLQTLPSAIGAMLLL